jgi:hypothetical protein
VPCGDARFQRTITVRADHRTGAATLFSDGVCWQIYRLYQLVDNGLSIRLCRGILLIQKPFLLRDYDALEQFTSVSLELYDQLMLTRAEGIDFIDDAGTLAVDQSTCMVCGDAIVNDLVFCQRCKTPHHGECWHYTGGCAIFGCREKRYLRPQIGVPKTDP